MTRAKHFKSSFESTKSIAEDPEKRRSRPSKCEAFAEDPEKSIQLDSRQPASQAPRMTSARIYLVGGAVRDQLLGLPIHERDYVVVGATPQEMTVLGYKPVGRDFPVFLHPQTHEEYALARTERKIGFGHQGFTFYTDPKVTLEEDLKRRDLTINAIAQDENGNLIDPYHGQQDLHNHILRHVSPAFSEDPLRILRVARFAAYLGQFDFKIAPETLALMQKMVQENALAELSDERVWQEVYRALQTDYPQNFFAVLEEIGALEILFTCHSCKSGNPVEASQILDPRLREDDKALLRFAIFSSKMIYLRTAPKEFEDLAHLVREKTSAALKFNTMNPKEKVHFLRSLDYLRRPERLELWITASKVVNSHFPSKALEQAVTILRDLNREAIAKQAKDPQHIAAAILEAESIALNSALALCPPIQKPSD